MQNQIMKTVKATTASPPTTPPTIGAMGVFLGVLFVFITGRPFEVLVGVAVFATGVVGVDVGFAG